MIQAIRTALYQARTPYFPIQHSGHGFYAVYLKCDHTISSLTVPDDGLLYIGMTERGFSARNHVTPKHSGYCTFRRSIGALLKDQIRLELLPRPRQFMHHNTPYYRFTEASEQRLGLWMAGALYVSRVPHEHSIAQVERQLIQQLEPPLNLTEWANPQADWVKAKRRNCLNEALGKTVPGAHLSIQETA